MSALVNVALGLLVAVQGAAGDAERPVGPATYVLPSGEVRAAQDWKRNRARVPGCPLRLPGMPPWRADHRPRQVVCVLVARSHAWQARVIYRAGRGKISHGTVRVRPRR